MRIPIREQLGLLVLFTSLIALAVIAIATVSILSCCVIEELRLMRAHLVGDKLQLRRWYPVRARSCSEYYLAER